MKSRLLPFILALCAAVLGAKGAPESPRALTSVRAIRGLSKEAVLQAPRVEIEGIVLVCHPSTPRHVLFVHDGTESIFTTTHARPEALPPGSRIRVSGKVAPGDFAPVILDAEVALIGEGPLPEPRSVTYDDLLTGKEDSQWIQLTGVVRSVALVDRQIRLQLAVGTRLVSIDVAGFFDDLPESAALEDAEVTITGAAMTGFNPRGQVVSALMMAPSMEMIRILRVAPRESEIPSRTFRDLLRFDPQGASDHRVKVTGTVTHFSPGEAVYLTDGETSLRATTHETVPLQPGSEVEVLGFPAHGAVGPILEHSHTRLLREGSAPAAIRVTFKQALSGDHEAGLVTLDARLLGQTRKAQDCDYVFESDGSAFRGSLSLPEGSVAPQLENGSLARLTGILMTEGELERREGPGFRPTAWHLLLRSPADIAVLQRPPWWTTQRILAALAISGFVLIGTLAWVVALRRRVEAQTAVIERQSRREAALEERNRIARELHDTLAQGFAGTAFALEGIATQLDGDDHPVRPHIEMALNMVRHSLTEARRSVMNLRANALENGDLGEALQEAAHNLAASSGVVLQTDIAPISTRLPQHLENNVFRIGVEAMTNALRHAKPRKLDVRLHCADDALVLSVQDDGTGFILENDPAKPGHFGMRGMRERAKQIHAQLDIASTPGTGTKVRLMLPLPASAKAEAEL